MSELPFVSVIVPVWNGEKLIVKCLRALEAQTYPKDRYEVIVVDNGSTDGTVAAIQSFPWARLLVEPVASSYRARNTGIAVARGEWVAFTDADCVPAPRWIEAAVEATRDNPGHGIYGGPIELFVPEGGGAPECIQHELLFAFNQTLFMSQGHFVTANLMCPRGVLAEVDNFNAQLKSGGDRDFCRRVREAGYTLAFVTDMVIGHPVRATFDDIARKRRRIVGGGWMKQPVPLTAPQLLLRESRRCAGETRHMLRTKGIPPLLRLRIVGLITRLWFSAVGEIARLQLGGTPTRD